MEFKLAPAACQWQSRPRLIGHPTMIHLHPGQVRRPGTSWQVGLRIPMIGFLEPALSDAKHNCPDDLRCPSLNTDARLQNESQLRDTEFGLCFATFEEEPALYISLFSYSNLSLKVDLWGKQNFKRTASTHTSHKRRSRSIRGGTVLRLLRQPGTAGGVSKAPLARPPHPS